MAARPGARRCSAALATKTIRTTTKEAELAKLFTNTWRYMKFAVANQFFMIADEAGVDYTNVLRAIREDYPRAADLPGPGFAAGPCLFKDTMQLAAFTTDHFPLGQAAMQVNEGLPAFIVGPPASDATAASRQDGRDPRDGLQGRVGRHARVAQLQAPQAPDLGGRRRVAARTRTSRTTACRRSRMRRQRATSSSWGSPTGHTAASIIGGKDIVDVWGAMGAGIRL